MDKYHNFLGLLLVFFTSCQESNDTNKINSIQLETTNDTSVEQKIDEQFTSTKIEDKLTKKRSGNELNVQIKQVGDTLLFMKNDELIKKTFVQPTKLIRKYNSQELTIRDEAFLLANNMIILRDVTTQGTYCQIPDVHQVEIYPYQKDTAIIIGDSLPSESLMGFDLVNNFLGNQFDSPSGEWGVITIEAEGEIYGLMLLYEGGKYREINLSNDYYLHGEIVNAEFNSSNELIWSTIFDNQKPVRMVINKKGEVRIEKK